MGTQSFLSFFYYNLFDLIFLLTAQLSYSFMFMVFQFLMNLRSHNIIWVKKRNQECRCHNMLWLVVGQLPSDGNITMKKMTLEKANCRGITSSHKRKKLVPIKHTAKGGLTIILSRTSNYGHVLNVSVTISLELCTLFLYFRDSIKSFLLL